LSLRVRARLETKGEGACEGSKSRSGSEVPRFGEVSKEAQKRLTAGSGKPDTVERFTRGGRHFALGWRVTRRFPPSGVQGVTNRGKEGER